jgi:predicted ATP-grasp superfamily ATP-dependent carboligase
VPIPRTWFPQSLDDIDEIAPQLAYPCILKPYTSHLGRKQIVRKVVVVGSFDELRTTFMRLHAPPVSFMVQEIVPGEDTNLVGYLAFWDHDGREVAIRTGTKSCAGAL